MVQTEVAFTVADEAGLDRVVEALGDRYALESEKAVRQRTYFDTFDWRLWRRKSRLWLQPSASGPQLRWQSEGRARAERLDLRSDDLQTIGFAADLPASPFRQKLASVITMRRLLPIVEVKAEGRLLRVLDRRRKTVVRLVAEVPAARAPGSRQRRRPLAPILIVRGVRGYPDDFRKLVRFLGKELGLEEWDADEFEAGSALGGFGRAGEYTSKPNVPLDVATPADEAVRQVLRALLGAIEKNHAGTVADLDSEFLHDFRVAVRRTRSALSLTRKLWPEARIEPLRREFSWLGKLTGPTRDLDVYLLELPGSTAKLAESVRRDLEPLRELLEARQQGAQRRMATELESARYRELIEAWRAFLEHPPADEERPEAAREPIGTVASRLIRKAHRKVLKRGRKISDDSPPEDLHRLRIDCKKLRYALELFRTLYPPEEIDRPVRALKRLQDNLGAFNDYGIQKRMLVGLAEELIDADSGGTTAVMALGRLVGELEQGEARERSRFAEAFGKFSSAKTVERFRVMFVDGGSE